MSLFIQKGKRSIFQPKGLLQKPSRTTTGSQLFSIITKFKSSFWDYFFKIEIFNFSPYARNLYVFLVLQLVLFSGNAQERDVIDQKQVWAGYMTSSRISEKYAIWNDFHYVPDGFFVARTGLTRRFFQNMNLTAGYAYLSLPVTSNEVKLNRNEHRPWAQVVVNHKVSNKLYMTNRLRYDMRFRQDFGEGELFDSFSFNHRVRMLIGVRIPLKGEEIKSGTPFLNVSNEILMNYGRNVSSPNYLDQNRFWVNFGWQFDNLSVQLGYMNRFVQPPNRTQMIRNHTLLLWVTQSFDFRKKANLLIIDDDEDYRAP